MSGGEQSLELRDSWRPLREAVTSLAFDGHIDPPAEALRRLCEGEWIAHAGWKSDIWAGAAFSSRDIGILRREQWQGLKQALGRGLSLLEDGEPLPNFGEGNAFPNVIGVDREMAFWGWDTNSFCTALLTRPDREERFIAMEIFVREPELVEAPSALPEVTGTNWGGRPSAINWEIAALEMSGRYYRGDFKPATIADVARALHAWASEKGQVLSEATARTHAKTIFDALRAWDAD